MRAVLVAALLALLTFFAAAQQCTEAMQIACTDDFRAAYPVCKKAAEAGGSDTAADLACMKYFNKMQPECWPCICWFAKEFQLPIKGCN
jgi:hypothetical protein